MNRADVVLYLYVHVLSDSLGPVQPNTSPLEQISAWHRAIAYRNTLHITIDWCIIATRKV